MSKEKKKFNETKLGQFLKDKVPGVLDVVDDYFPPAKILTALVGKNLPPEDQLKFEQLLQEHEKEMYALEVQDRSSARTRETEFVKATGHIDYLMWFLAIAGVGIFGYMVFYVLNHTIPETSRELVFHIFGLVEGAMLVNIYNYYFGSSAGSRIKDMKK